MLDAVIRFSHTTATGQQFVMRVDSLDIEESGKSPSTALCRKIMESNPELSDNGILVRSPDGREIMTIGSIGKHSSLQYYEGDNGISIRKYQPMPEGLHNK